MQIFNTQTLLVVASLLAVSVNSEEIITGTIFCDNYFEFWFNGELIVKDPFEFAPHNAVNVSFIWDGVSDKTYAILCQDYMNKDYGDTGFEYADAPVWNMETESCCYMSKDTLMLDSCTDVTKEECPTSCPANKGIGFWEDHTNSDRCTEDGNCIGCGPWIGDGSLLADFSDGTQTNKDWKVYVASFGPTDNSIAAGCSYKNFNPCEVEFFDVPETWYASDYDDSKWDIATEFTVQETGWGRTPTYNATSGECCGIMSQGRRLADPVCMKVPPEHCLNPKEVLCDKSGGSICPGPTCAALGPQCDRPEDPRMIWSADLQRAQQNFFRYTVSASGNNGDSGTSSATIASKTNFPSTVTTTMSVLGIFWWYSFFL